MFIGTEIQYDPRLSTLERWYIRLLGVPINGLRIRARHILPLVQGPWSAILDAGCGLGVFSLEMAKRMPQARVQGIDLNEKQIGVNNQIARSANLANCSFRTADAAALEDCEAYDLVLSVDVIEHVEDDLEACRRMARALRAGGRLVMHVPAMYRRWILWGRRLNFTHEKGHVRPGYTPESIRDLLSQAGFDVETVRYTYGAVETVTNNIANLISRSNKQNKIWYALVFPVLLFVSYWGQFGTPRDGSGILVTARKRTPAKA